MHTIRLERPWDLWIWRSSQDKCRKRINNSGKGTVAVTIDNRDSRVLSAGLCIEDSGGTLGLRHDREGQAVINYRSMPASSNW